MSISFNQLNGPDVSDGRGNTTLGTLSSQNPNGQNLNNTAVGFGALRDNAGGQHNIAVGLNALANNSASNNVAIGENALYNFLAPSTTQTGTLNVAVGNNAMQSNTAGIQNVAVGNQALHNNTTGSYNAVVGNAAGYFNTTGQNNAVLGANALLNNTTGSQNVAIGKEALQTSQTTSGNVAVGHHALKFNTTGTGNIGIGNHALSGHTTSSNNVGIGQHISSNGYDSCILLGNNAQAVNSNEIGIGGINLVNPSPTPSNISGYLPVRLANSVGQSPNQLYYVPMYNGGQAPLEIPEVIIANRSIGGVGLLIGFPSTYASVSNLMIINGSYSVTVPMPISTAGYYVYYQDGISDFWPSLTSVGYNNIVMVVAPTMVDGSSKSLCDGLTTGGTLQFKYTLSGQSYTISYLPTQTTMNIPMGNQYEQYIGSGAPSVNAEGFQWGQTVNVQETWGTQTGSGTQTYAQWQAVTNPADYQYNSIYKYLYPYSTVSGPGPGSSASMTWPVTKTVLSIASGATYTIGGTDIPAPTITGVTGAAPTITYNISCDSNMPSITLTNGSTLTVGWDAWSTSVSTGLLTNVYIIASATIQGTLTSAYLTTVLTVGSSNTLTWAFSPYTQLTAPTLYTIPAALTFSASPPYYTNTAAFTVTNAYTNVAITSSVTSVATATTSGTTTTIAPSSAGSTIITATSSTGKTRTLLTIAAPPSSGVTLLYSQMTNPTLISPPLAVAPNTLPPSQQFIANEFGSNISGIIDYFHLPFIQFANVQTSVPFTMTLAKNGTTLVTTTFSLPGNAGTTTYLNGINIPFLLQSAANNAPSIIFTFNPPSPTSTTTTITNLDQITISLNATSTISGGTWQIKMSGGEMAGTVYGISTQFLPLTVPTFTPASLTFADVVYTTGLAIPFTLVSSNTNTPITHTISSIPSDVGTISELANSGSGPTSYRVNVSKPGTATITFTQAASGSFSGKTITATLNVLNAPTITFTSLVNSKMTYAIGGKTIALNNALTPPAATSTNTNVPITYSLTGVSNIAGTTNPCATITTTGSNQTLTLFGVGSFTLVASQVASTTHGPSTAPLVITIVPGDGPSNPIVLNTIVSNLSTAPFVLDLLVNSGNSVSMSYATNINAVVTYFNIPYFKVDTNGASMPVSFTLTVFRGQAGSVPSIPVSTTNFTITTNSFGNYNPTGGITVPLSTPVAFGAPGYMPTTAGVSGVTTSNAGQLQLYAIQNPSTPYSISTTTPNILIVLTPSTSVNYGSVTVDVNTNNPSGMLGTLYGYIQLLSPNLTFSNIVTPITWASNKYVSFTQATNDAIDSSLLTYSSSNTNVATIPVSTTNSMTLATTQPTTPTNVITISATRAATATYSMQTVSMNPTTTPPYPICIKTYALTSEQKMVFTNPKSSTTPGISVGAPVMITFIASESFKSLDSLNFAINGGQYGYTDAPIGTTPIFTINMTVTGSSNTSTSIQITMKATTPNSYDSTADGTLREIPFAALDNYPTSIQSFSCTGNSKPTCYTGDIISISMSCNTRWYINQDPQQNVITTIVGTPLVPPTLLPTPKILYMTSSDSTILSTTAANSNQFVIFKKAVITSFQITGVRPQGRIQQFTLAAEQRIYSSAGNYNSYNTLSISFTYDFGTSYDSTFTSIKVPFSYTEYSRLYPTSSPMTAFSIYVGSNLPAQSVPTPFLININDMFMCTLTYVSVGAFAVNTLGNMMSGSVYGYEILANPNLGALTVPTPINYLSNNPGRIITITPLSSTLTFTYTASSRFTLGTGANSNTFTMPTPGYSSSVQLTATSSETNQYISSSVNQYIDVVMRTEMPPNCGAIMNLNPSAYSPTATTTYLAYTYANVFTYFNNPVELYGFGFFEFTTVSNSYSFTYDIATSQSTSPTFTFVISKLKNGSWVEQRTITFTYKGNMNSSDDGSMFIVPFYNIFSSPATNQLPLRNMPSNITNLTVTDNTGTNQDVNSPPSYNPADALMLKMICYNANGSPNRGSLFPLDQYGQLSGTLLTPYSNVLNPTFVNNVFFNSSGNVGYPGQTQFSSTTFQNQVTHMVVTGLMIPPIMGVPNNTQFQINFYINNSIYFNIQATTTIDNAFSLNPGLYLFFGMPTTNTYQGAYANRFVINAFSTNTDVVGSYLNHGLGGSNATAFTTNPWIAANTPIFFTIIFTGLNGKGITLVPWWATSNGVATSNIPGIFIGNNTTI